PRRLLEALAELVRAVRDLGERARAGAELDHGVGEIDLGTDPPRDEAALAPALADARVDQGRLVARVGADQQAEIGLLDPGDGGVEQIAAAGVRLELRAVLAAVEMRRAGAGHQVLQHDHGLAVDQVADDRGDALARHPGQAIADRGERVAPVGQAQLAVLLDHGHVEAALLQAVVREAALVGDPLLVDVLVQARHDAHDLGRARVDPDVAADRIEDVDRFGLAQLPGAGAVFVGLGVERADRAQVDDVALQFGFQGALDPGADLLVLAAVHHAELLDPGDLVEEADAARAVDAAGHVGRDQRPEVLVEHAALVLFEARVIRPVEQGQVLQVALAALIADRAVERMVDQEELEHALA